eukprot:Rhum_TRINITY_DN14679_c13_g1::Rhum_TRINITY_DN14679_c13_g1_i1::g.110375::m.110375
MWRSRTQVSCAPSSRCRRRCRRSSSRRSACRRRCRRSTAGCARRAACTATSTWRCAPTPRCPRRRRPFSQPASTARRPPTPSPQAPRSGSRPPAAARRTCLRAASRGAWMRCATTGAPPSSAGTAASCAARSRPPFSAERRLRRRSSASATSWAPTTRWPHAGRAARSTTSCWAAEAAAPQWSCATSGATPRSRGRRRSPRVSLTSSAEVTGVAVLPAAFLRPTPASAHRRLVRRRAASPPPTRPHTHRRQPCPRVVGGRRSRFGRGGRGTPWPARCRPTSCGCTTLCGPASCGRALQRFRGRWRTTWCRSGAPCTTRRPQLPPSRLTRN